ncbi:hypothetical protein QYE76_006401 [Lolium multiflorum]|uniref:Integrase catalytic domain-containing protein n=1 Tax=Lolium multiflorum TaxID=4521 RepID=A0AAD8W4C4_LOLMU|nr:hypothetical protein QYE76_006401 [Lolium multiflorum]
MNPLSRRVPEAISESRDGIRGARGSRRYRVHSSHLKKEEKKNKMVLSMAGRLVFCQDWRASNELWRIILEGFKPYNPDKLTRREAVDSQLNNTALHMIQTSVGTQELPRVRNYTTAKEAWDGLAASCIGSESTRRNKYNALRNQAEGFMRLPDEDHQVMYGRLLIVADAFRLSGATHINDSWIKEKYIECMMPFVPIDVKTLVGRECYSSLSSQDAVHEMQALKVLEQNSHDSRNRAIGMAKGNNLALVVNPVEEVYPQEQYRASWSMTYPEDLECHYHDHMAFHAKSFWVDPSKAKEDNIKRNHKSGFTSFGPKTRSCYNCDDKLHFIAECPYENRELHNGRLIPKDKSKDTKGKYSKAPNKKFYNNKTKKGKRPPRVVLVTREEYSTDEVQSSSDDEGESSKEVAAIVTTNIPSSSLFESPNENPHVKNAHCFMAKSSLDTSIVLSTQEEYTSGDDDVDDEEDATSNGLVALASLSTNSSSPSEPPNEIIHVEEESCLMAKSSKVSSPSPSMPNISSDLGVDDSSLKVKQEMLEFDEFILNLQGINKKHVSNLMARLAQQNATLEKKGQIEREDSLEIHALKNALEESQETIASLEERLENLEEPQDEINKLTKARDHARAKTKLLKKEMAQFGVDHEKLVKDLDELDKAHKALKSEYALLSKSNEQLQIRLASYDVPSSSTPSCDHANIIEENVRLKDELAKASSPQSKLSLDDLLSKQRSNNGKEGLGYGAKAKKANKQKAKPAQEKKKDITNGEAPKGKTINDDDAGNANPHYVLFKDYYGDVYAKYVGPYDGYVAWTMPPEVQNGYLIVDTSHMTSGKNLVKELRPNINNITVSFGDNSTSETKDETQQIFIDFATEVQRQHNLLIMAIRSDNGPEFKNYTLNDFLSDEGIRHQYSAAYTPQQNGVAERKNRTLMDMARSMMAEYKSRYNFWAEAISTACHSSNRLYLRKGLNKTPYEILTGNKPNISYFKVFLMTDNFEMSMMGEMKFFLGFEIKQLREGTFINQAKYLQDMLKRFKMTKLKGVATPMVTKCHLALDPNGKEWIKSVPYHMLLLPIAFTSAGGSHRSSSGKRGFPTSFEAEILPAKKASRREQGVAFELRAAIIRRLRGTPIGKWPDHEYARLRQTNPYTSPKGKNCSELFWTRYQEKTFDDLYANATYKVAPMHHINFVHMDKNAEYFAEAREIWSYFCTKLPKTEEIIEGHEAARGQGGAAALAARPYPRAPRGPVFFRLLKVSVANPKTESHDTENLPETPPLNPISGDSEIARTRRRGIISRGLFIAMIARSDE